MAADQDSGFEQPRKPTRREEFLQVMDAIVPWAALCQVIEPHYPKAGNGRPPIGLERMLRIHFLQHWFNLADLACEEVLYDSASLRRFVGIDLGRESVLCSRWKRPAGVGPWNPTPVLCVPPQPTASAGRVLPPCSTACARRASRTP